MPSLQNILEGNDLGFFRIVANLWGIEFNAPDAYTALSTLVNSVRDPQLAGEIIETLPQNARHALQALWENEGHLPWGQFCRTFGEVRELGAARRDRERPDLNPTSPTEVLWYRALIGRLFLHFPPAEPQEYACVPEEILEILQLADTTQNRPLGRPASPGERAFPLPANDRILDHACTLLAALRMGMKPGEMNTAHWDISLPILQALLRSARLINARAQPEPDATRAFLEAPRPDSLAQLVTHWMNSSTFNELRFLPGLKFEGEWQNTPLRTRQAVFEMLSRLPQDTWWSLNSFVASVKDQRPDYQRPGGDYDSWFILQETNSTYLRGFSSWDEVDGALLRFFINGPLHWLGIFDLAAPDSRAAPSAFRFSAWAPALWHNKPPEMPGRKEDPIRITADGILTLTTNSSLSARYQVARFCRWVGESEEKYIYRLTPDSLERAASQGLKIAHFMALLKRHASAPLPPVLVQALERWEKFGSQSSISRVTILRVTAPEILAVLAQTRASRYLGEILNPTTIILKPGGEEAVRKALAEKGYLLNAFLEEGGV